MKSAPGLSNVGSPADKGIFNTPVSNRLSATTTTTPLTPLNVRAGLVVGRPVRAVAVPVGARVQGIECKVVPTAKPVRKVTAVPAPNRVCPGKHVLRRHLADEHSFKCDYGSHSIAEGTVLYGCRSCNYDECNSCYSKDGLSGVASIGPHSVEDREGHGKYISPVKVCIITILPEEVIPAQPHRWRFEVVDPSFNGTFSFQARQTPGRLNEIDVYVTRTDIPGAGWGHNLQLFWNVQTDRSDGTYPDCLAKHGLDLHFSDVDNIKCDVCHFRFSKDTEMYGCRECNYDVCLGCYHPVVQSIKHQKTLRQMNGAGEWTCDVCLVAHCENDACCRTKWAVDHRLYRAVNQPAGAKEFSICSLCFNLENDERKPSNVKLFVTCHQDSLPTTINHWHHDLMASKSMASETAVKSIASTHYMEQTFQAGNWTCSAKGANCVGSSPLIRYVCRGQEVDESAAGVHGGAYHACNYNMCHPCLKQFLRKTHLEPVEVEEVPEPTYVTVKKLAPHYEAPTLTWGYARDNTDTLYVDQQGLKSRKKDLTIRGSPNKRLH